MSDNIKLHPKYGLNPTMTICCWCGEPDGGIALLGAAYKDEAPPYMIDKQPCEKCREQMNKGITVAEVDKRIDKMARVEGRGIDALPLTGRWVVLNEAGIRSIIKPEAAEQVIKARFCAMEVEAWERLFGAIPDTKEASDAVSS